MHENLPETVAAVGLHFGISPFREGATRALRQFSELYPLAVLSASILSEEAKKEEFAWGDEADWMLVVQSFSDRVLEYMSKHRTAPTADHVQNLAKESIYKFLEPKIPGEIRDEKKLTLIRDLLVSAFEGGSNYWYQVIKETLPRGTKKADFQKGGKMQPPNDYYHPYELIPTLPGGSLTIGNQEDDDEYKLDLAKLEKGLALYAHQFPERYNKALVDGDYDGDDGDLFLQLALFGKQVFG